MTRDREKLRQNGQAAQNGLQRQKINFLLQKFFGKYVWGIYEKFVGTQTWSGMMFVGTQTWAIGEVCKDTGLSQRKVKLEAIELIKQKPTEELLGQ